MRRSQVWTVEESRLHDGRAQEVGVPFLSLMEVAGAKAAAFWLPQLPEGKGLVLAGPGHNGGDALVVARYVSRFRPTDLCFPLGAPTFDGAAGLKRAAENYGARLVDVPRAMESMAGYRWVVDGIFGTGFHGSLAASIQSLFRAAADAGTEIYALDILSGVDADSGSYSGPGISVASTVTFGAAKWGHFGYPGVRYCGQLAVADIGLGAGGKGPGSWITPQWAKSRTQEPDPMTYKYRRGRVAVAGGSVSMTGAPVMSGMAALRAGAGIVQLIIPEPAARRLSAPEPLMIWRSAGRGAFTAGDLAQMARADVIVFGPGMGAQMGAGALDQVIALGKPMVVDADGLNLLAQLPARTLPLGSVLTPHSGEMGRLLGMGAGEVDSNRLQAFRRARDRYQAAVVLKGIYTIAGDSELFINTANTTALATAGSGDVLSGITAAVLASMPGETGGRAAALASYVHGWTGIHAGRIHGPSVVATDLIEALGQAWTSVKNEEEPPGLPRLI